ncbi:hypothetical protein FRC09_001649 [Ceratobasidium sp. 395]|nr:hypothetical protein FRC09_001649 [Ceratobasidium sp. 395]
MDEEGTGRSKRAITKTNAIEDFDEGVVKSKSNYESRQRTKNIRAEVAALNTAETEAIETEAIKSPKKTKSKKKNTKSKKAANDEVDDHEFCPILTKLNADEAKAQQYKNIIHHRDIIPYNILDMVDYEDLEAFYLAGEDAAKVLLTSGPHAKPPKPKTLKAAAKAPPVAKTPAPKRIAAIVLPASIKSLGSPINALASAKKQAARVADTPIAATRKRASSTDRGGAELKRQRTAALNNIKPSKSNGNCSVSGPASMSASHAASSSLNKGLHSISRQSSRAPLALRAGSQAPKALAAVPTSGPAFADPNSEMLGPSNLDEGMEDVEEKPKKKRAAPGQGKERARRGDYVGLELRILDETFSLVSAQLGSDGTCPTGGNFKRLIWKCWVEATKQLETTPEKYPCDQYHVRITTDRVSSYQSHAKRNISGPAVVVYGLDTLKGEDLKNHVKYLIKKKKLYKGDKVDGCNGLYEHPLIIHALQQLYFASQKSSATRFPEDYNPVLPNALATAVAIYCTGKFVEEKLDFDTFYNLWHQQLENVHWWMGQVKEEVHVKVRTLLYEAALNGSGKITTIPDGDDKNCLTLSNLESSSDDEPTLALWPTSGFKAAPSSSKPSGLSKPKNSKTLLSKPSGSAGKLTSSQKLKLKPKPKSRLSTVPELPSSPSKPPSSPPPSKPRSLPALPEALPSKPGCAGKNNSSSSESSSELSDSESESESESNSDPTVATKPTGSSHKSAQTSLAPKVAQLSPASKDTSGVPKTRLSAAAPKNPDSSDLSSDEGNADDNTGKGPKRDEKNVDVDLDLDEDVEKPEKQGETDEGDDSKNGGDIASPSDSTASGKSGRKAAKQPTGASVGTAGSPTKKLPTKESSSVQPSTKDLAVEGDELAKELPKTKEKKGKGKKVSKGKERDPGESGTRTGVSTRSSRKSA